MQSIKVCQVAARKDDQDPETRKLDQEKISEKRMDQELKTRPGNVNKKTLIEISTKKN